MKNKIETNKDTGDSIVADNASWTFSGDVAKHFDNHVNKSVPFYKEGHDLIAKLSDFYLDADSICYELGCSTGKLCKTLAERHINKAINIIGIDKEKGMIVEANNRCQNNSNVKIINSDLLEMEYNNCDMIISYYTVQFIAPKHRQQLFDQIYQALNWGGAFVLFEKVRASDARFQDVINSLYNDFKLDQGYTPNEIMAKSRSLKGVLEPFSSRGNLDLMVRAGFVDILTIFKYMCFEGFLAIK